MTLEYGSIGVLTQVLELHLLTLNTSTASVTLDKVPFFVQQCAEVGFFLEVHKTRNILLCSNLACINSIYVKVNLYNSSELAIFCSRGHIIDLYHMQMALDVNKCSPCLRTFCVHPNCTGTYVAIQSSYYVKCTMVMQINI